jgi:hypothetical protein
MLWTQIGDYRQPKYQARADDAIPIEFEMIKVFNALIAESEIKERGDRLSDALIEINFRRV